MFIEFEDKKKITYLVRNYFLAGKGVDTDKLNRNLNAINIKTTFEPIQGVEERDIEGYLKHEHELLILTAIEEAKRQVYPYEFISI